MKRADAIKQTEAGRETTKGISADLSKIPQQVTPIASDMTLIADKLREMSLKTTTLDGDITHRNDNVGTPLRSLTELGTKINDLNVQGSASTTNQTKLQNLSDDFVDTLEKFKWQVEELKLDIDNVHVMVDSTQADVTVAYNEVSALSAELMVMRPLIPLSFDEAANEAFAREHKTPPYLLAS